MLHMVCCIADLHNTILIKEDHESSSGSSRHHLHDLQRWHVVHVQLSMSRGQVASGEGEAGSSCKELCLAALATQRMCVAVNVNNMLHQPV